MRFDEIERIFEWVVTHAATMVLDKMVTDNVMIIVVVMTMEWLIVSTEGISNWLVLSTV